MFKCKAIFLLLLLVAAYCPGCKNDGDSPVKINPGGTYRIPLTQGVTSLDPVSGATYAWFIGAQIYEGLVAYAPENSAEIVAWLAETFTSDSLTLTFRLRKGVTFHDAACFPDGKGREVSASDVKYSFERFYRWQLSAGLSSAAEYLHGFEPWRLGQTDSIEGLQVTDKLTLQMHFTRNVPNLLYEIGSIAIVPREAVEYYGADFKFHPVGTGPFRFIQIIPNEKVALTRNEKYWRFENQLRLPYLDAIEFISYAPDEIEKMLLDFQTGWLDECTQEIAKPVSHLVKLNEHGEVLFTGWLQDKGVQFIKDNVFSSLRYLEIVESNQKIRQAIAFAINRQRLVEKNTSLFNKYVAAKGPVPPDASFYNDKYRGQYYDPETARKLLAEAGFPHGKGFAEIPFISLPSPDVDLIAADLQAVGFKVQKRKPFPGWRNLIEAGGPVLIRMINMATSPDRNYYFLSSPDEECHSNEQFVRLLHEITRTQQNYKNKEMLQRLEELLVDCSPVAYLYHIDGEFRFLQRYVRGRKLGPASWHRLDYVWLDKDEGAKPGQVGNSNDK